MIFSRPPQFGQRAMSISKAKLQRSTNLYSGYVAAKTRLSSLAQRSRTGW